MTFLESDLPPPVAFVCASMLPQPLLDTLSANRRHPPRHLSADTIDAISAIHTTSTLNFTY